MKFYLIILAFVVCFFPVNDSTAQTVRPKTAYHLIQTIVIGGEGTWDYPALDAKNHRLYVSHESEVAVVDIDRGNVVGRIPTQGVHGMALVPGLGKIFVSEGKADFVSVFNIKTLSPLGEAKTGKDPDAIIYDHASGRLFVSNGDSEDITVIDATTGRTVGTIPVGGDPESIAVDGKGNLWVNLEDKNEVLKIDTKKLRVKKRWPIPGCQVPKGLALDRDRHRLFVGCRNHVMAVANSENGNVITTLPIGDHVDTTIFDAATRMIFNSNGDGTVTIISEDTSNRYHIAETVLTQNGAKTMAYDQGTKRLYLPVADHSAPQMSSAGNFVVLVYGQ